MKGRISFIPFATTLPDKEGEKCASTRFRCYQNARALRDLGWECTIGEKGAESADIVIFQKRYFAKDIDLAKRCKGKIILDLSDPDWLKWPNRENPLDAMAEIASCVTTSSTKLANIFQQKGKRAEYISEGFDFSTIPESVEKQEKLTLCWHGNRKNEEYFKVIVEPLNRLKKEFDFDLRFVVDKPVEKMPKFDFEPQIIPWELETHLKYIAECHIGLSPLLLDEWCSYKNPHKLFTYMALGLPVVATAIPSYQEIIKNEVNGFIIEKNDPEAWYNALKILITDEGKRNSIIEEGKKITQEYSVENMAKKWDSLFKSLKVIRKPRELIVDLGCGAKKRSKGGKLTSTISKEDCREMLKLQLGKPPSQEKLDNEFKRFSPLIEVVGIDNKKESGVDIICRLGYEKIPLNDESIDYVLAHDFIEHIPFVDEDKKPVAFLFNEVYRILKNGGYFEIKTPGFPMYKNWHKFFPPQHKSYWGPNTIDIFLEKFHLCSKYICSDGKIHFLLMKYHD